MYDPIEWKDHVTDPENEYIVEQIDGNRYKITPCGEIMQRGTLLSAENFNKGERGLTEATAALCTLLQLSSLRGDDMSDVLKKSFFITEEHSVSIDDYGDESVRKVSFCKFGSENIRKNADYAVIPFVTAVEVKNTQNYSQEELTYQVCLPEIVTSERTAEGFTVSCYRPYKDSDFLSMTYRFLIIGGI